MPINKKTKVLFLLLGVTILCNAQIQMGNDIEGEFENDEFGTSIGMSADGQIIAIGGYRNGGKAHQAGHVRVYKLSNEEWIQLGGDINGEEEKDQSGWSVSQSSDGKTVAIGTINSKEGGNNSGHVRVFRFIGGEWILLGKSIAGKGNGYSFGWSVFLSSNGNRVAIGGYGSLYFEERPCYVGVYEFINGEWNKIGQEIDGYINEGFGREVVLSGEGNRVAIASPSNRNCPVRIYDFINGEWKQLGKAIKNKRAIDATGSSIGMSKDGKIAAAGSIFSGDSTNTGTGYVHVYDIADIKVEENLEENCNEIIEEEIEEIKEYHLFPNPTLGYLTVQGVDLEELKENKKKKPADNSALLLIAA